MLKLRLVIFLLIISAIESVEAQTGLYFDGVNDHVTFGVAPGLNGSQFTLEIWFKREGAGLTSNTGTGGVKAFPLITKGRNETEGSTVDANYFLGIDSATNVLAADFEEITPGPVPGLNHPILGTTPICYHVWYHAAATYDGTTWRLFLNGNLENTLVVNRTPQSASIQHAALATAMNSTGVASGFFNGRLDEARIWNYARTQADISNNLNSEISSAPGLIGRYGMNEGTGTSLVNSGTATANGTLVNGPLWVEGTSFEPLPTNGNIGMYLAGTNSYVPLGNPAAIRLSQFTLEAWFIRTGNGVATSTGTGGINAIPLITKGRAEADGDNRDMNYFLGIDATTNVLMADMEEGTGQASPGLNHPIAGVTPITNNIWYHAAVTYDGSTWKLYLNGALESQLAVGRLPQSASIQQAAIGSSLTSTGAAAGYFKGIIDEVRIWNSARTQAVIQSKMNQQLPGANAGMVARWSMNEGCGAVVRDSSGSAITSTMISTNWYWAEGAPFNVNVNNAPSQPVLVSPSNNSSGVAINTSLAATVADPESNSLTVSYYGSPCPPTVTSQDFTIIGLPDTQFYTSELNGGTNAMYKSQMNWIVANLNTENIVYMQGLGDCVQNGDNVLAEWQRTDTAMRIIEDPLSTALTDGVPYGINVGNHDQTPVGSPAGTTTMFNSYFGSSRFAGRAYYGGHYGTNNNNNYTLFSAGGLDFININIEYAPSMDANIITWMQNLLTTYSNRRAIIGSHYILNANGTFGTQGQALYNAVKAYPNVFLMLCGHVTEEAKRQDTYNGNTITTLMSDYQARTNGGNGWLRIMKFSPVNNTISVKTYSPWLNQYETDANSQFVINYNMQPTANFSLIGTNTGISSGTTPNLQWNNLQSNTCYQWYISINDGTSVTTSPIWTFTTGNTLPIELMSFTGKAVDEKVQLDWKTNSEVNNAYFAVERSSDGQHFEVISTVNGYGNSSETHEYQTMDLKPLIPLNYYRLKQTDYDNKFTYSSTIAVTFKRNKFLVYPNPSIDGTFNITSVENKGNVEISVVNILGNEIYKQTTRLNSDNVITLEHFATGVYQIILNYENGKTERSTVVVK